VNPAETPNAEVQRLERINLAVDGRRQGKTYRVIASELHVDVKTAYQYVHAYFDELKRLATEELEEVRSLELQRLDWMLARLCKIIDRETYQVFGGENGEDLVSESADETVIKAIAAACKLMERRAKLLGLDAPTKVETKDTSEKAETEEQLWARIEKLKQQRDQDKETHH